jgi:hypothetical protein
MNAITKLNEQLNKSQNNQKTAIFCNLKIKKLAKNPTLILTITIQ